MTTNPQDILTLYRQQFDKFTLEQIKMFNKMSVNDRMELVFCMLMHTNKIVQQLHGLIQPGGAETQDMPTPEKVN